MHSIGSNFWIVWQLQTFQWNSMQNVDPFELKIQMSKLFLSDQILDTKSMTLTVKNGFEPKKWTKLIEMLICVSGEHKFKAVVYSTSVMSFDCVGSMLGTVFMHWAIKRGRERHAKHCKFYWHSSLLTNIAKSVLHVVIECVFVFRLTTLTTSNERSADHIFPIEWNKTSDSATAWHFNLLKWQLCSENIQFRLMFGHEMLEFDKKNVFEPKTIEIQCLHTRRT